MRNSRNRQKIVETDRDRVRKKQEVSKSQEESGRNSAM